MKASPDQIGLLHETIGVVRRFCQDRKIFPEGVQTITEVGEPNKIECVYGMEVFAVAEIDEDVVTITMHYKSKSELNNGNKI